MLTLSCVVNGQSRKAARVNAQMTERQTFRIVIPGKPVAWARPRTGRQGQWYNTGRTETARETIAWLAREALQGRDAPLFTGPVQVNLVFDFGADPKTIIEVKPIFPERECHLGKEDLDNLCKLAIEAISGDPRRHIPGIVLDDDSQVCRLEAVKVRGET